MSQRPNGSWRGAYRYISALAITAAVFMIAVLPVLLPSKAMSGTRASNTQAANTGKWWPASIGG